MNNTYHFKSKHRKLKILITFILILVLFNPISLNFYYHSIKKIANSDGIASFNDEYTGVESNGDLVNEQDVQQLQDSKITGEGYEFDTTYYPYFSYLSADEKIIYKQIYANATEISKYFVPKVKINISQLKKVFEAVYNDHPELFWLNTSYSYKYTPDNNCVQIILSFNETINDIVNAKKKFDTEVNKIISAANKLKTNYEKEKYVHDTIVKSVKYDKNASMNQSAYSALVNKSTICAGYSRAFQYIMINLHIPTYYCVGISSVNHAWNIVKLDDGYYNVDLTWDNTDSNRYKYFNKTDSDFSITHKRTGLSLKLPKCNATKYRTINTRTSNTVYSSDAPKSNKTVNSNLISNEKSNSNLSNNNVNKDNTTSNIVDNEGSNIESNYNSDINNSNSLDEISNDNTNENEDTSIYDDNSNSMEVNDIQNNMRRRYAER